MPCHAVVHQGCVMHYAVGFTWIRHLICSSVYPMSLQRHGIGSTESNRSDSLQCQQFHFMRKRMLKILGVSIQFLPFLYFRIRASFPWRWEAGGGTTTRRASSSSFTTTKSPKDGGEQRAASERQTRVISRQWSPTHAMLGTFLMMSNGNEIWLYFTFMLKLELIFWP